MIMLLIKKYMKKFLSVLIENVFYLEVEVKKC